MHILNPDLQNVMKINPMTHRCQHCKLQVTLQLLGIETPLWHPLCVDPDLLPRLQLCKHNEWITKGIKISCQSKRYLYSIYKNTNNPQVKAYYRKYNNILKKVIISAKKLYYDKRIELLSNRVKITWSIIKDLTGKTQTTVTKMEIKSEAGTLTNNNNIAKAISRETGL